MGINTILGLPAHPLLVHAPVVLIPLTLLMAIGAVVWAPARHALALGAFLAASAGMVGAQLAVMSGESLEERVDESAILDQHAALGEATRTLAIIVFIAACAFVLRVWGDRLPGALGRVGDALRAPVVGVLIVVVLIGSSLACTVWAARAGHAGAKAAWGDLPAANAHNTGDTD